jgi:hypothetical protein
MAIPQSNRQKLTASKNLPSKCFPGLAGFALFGAVLCELCGLRFCGRIAATSKPLTVKNAKIKQSSQRSQPLSETPKRMEMKRGEIVASGLF